MAVKRIAIPKSGGPRSLAQWKQFFFDREAVTTAVGKKQAGALARYSGYLRRVAQTSMRYRKGISPAGQPPSAHKSKRLAALKKKGRAKNNGALLRELILFAYDAATKSSVVGPLGFKTRGGRPVPELHEHGGSVAAGGRTVVVKNKPGRDERGKFVSAGERLERLTGTLHYPPRPTMRPAMMKTRERFPEAFRNLL